jgi:hypothetical protein
LGSHRYYAPSRAPSPNESTSDTCDGLPDNVGQDADALLTGESLCVVMRAEPDAEQSEEFREIPLYVSDVRLSHISRH